VAKLLAGFVSADNSVRNEAEKHFEGLKKLQPQDVLLSLVHLLAHSASYEYLLDENMGREAMSSLSAVLIRGITVRERALWATLTTSDLAECRTQMLQSLLTETVPHVRRKIANAVASHAKLSPWPELLAVVQQLAEAGVPEKSRQLSMFLLDQLAEHIGDYLIGHMQTLWSVIAPVLAGESGEALASAAAAACSLCSLLTETHAHAHAHTQSTSTSGDSSSSSSSSHNTSLWGSGLARSAELARVLACSGQFEDSAQELLIALLRLAEAHALAFSTCFDVAAQSLLALATSVDARDNMRSLALQTITELLTNESSRALASQSMRHSALNAAMNACTNIDASEEGTAEFLAEAESSCSGGGGSFGESGDDGNSELSAAAGTCLSTMCHSFDPTEVVQTCLHSVWQFLFDKNNWCARRAALLVISIICEGARDELEPLLAELVPAMLSSCADGHPRVRHAALQCVVEFIRQFRRVVEDEDEEEEEWGDDDEGEEQGDKIGEEKKSKADSFQQQFYATVPPALCAALQANQNIPRVAYMAVHALLLFFDPDYCESALCDVTLLQGLLMHCLQVVRTVAGVDNRTASLQSTSFPLYVIHETASLIGNLSNMLSEEVMSTHYTDLMSVMCAIIGDLSHATDKTDHAATTLRCRCLEAAAFIGKSVSLDLFRPDALVLAQQLSALTNAGLDFSDELSSYISQTCVRLAGALGAEFHPYVPLVLPSVIAHIAQEITVEVSVADENSGKCGNSESEEENAEIFHVYKRGIGLMRIQVSSYALQEKVMACRVLYQYTLDVPQFLTPYVPSAIEALVQVMQSFAFDEECAEVVGATLSELMVLFCRQTPFRHIQEQTPVVQHMLERAVEGLVNAIELKQGQDQEGRATSRTEEHQAFLHYMLDGLRELLQLMYAMRVTHVHPWKLAPPHGLLKRVLAVSRDQLISWVNLRYAGNIGLSIRSDVQELEHSTRDCCVDILGWTLKFSTADVDVNNTSSGAGGDTALQQAYLEEVLPLLEGILTSNLTSAAAAPLLMVPVLGLLDAIQCIPIVRVQVAQLLLPQLLRIWECESLAVPCIYGLGVCVQHGQVQDVGQVSAALMTLVRVLGLDSTAQPVQLDLDEEQAGLLHNNAVASILRLAIYARVMIGSEMAVQMLSIGLDELPLTADITEAKVLHEWFIAMLVTRDPMLFDTNIQLIQGATCFRVAAALVLLVTTALIKQRGISSDMFSSAKSVKKGSNSKKKAGNADWAAGEEDEFWAEQVANKSTYMAARALVLASLQPIIDPEIMAAITSFSKKQQAVLQQLGSPILSGLLE